MLNPLPLRHYQDVLGPQGFDAARWLAGSGIPAAQLDEPDTLVDMAAYQRVLENIAQLAPQRSLGLDVGRAFDMAHLGPLAYAALSCSTPRQSMEEFWGRHGKMLGVLAYPRFVAETDDILTVDIVTPRLSPAAQRFCVEEAFGLLIGIGRQVAGRKPIFQDVTFAYAQPADIERYRTLFRCPLSFNAPQTRARIARRWLEQALPTQDAPLRDFYQRHLGTVHRDIEHRMPLAQRVQQCLLGRTQADMPSLAEVAAQLDMSERTLSRHLQQDGLTYRQLLQEHRLQQAAKLLQAPGASAEAVAQQVGFHDVNAFRRAFRQWTGHTVARYMRSQNKPTPPHAG